MSREKQLREEIETLRLRNKSLTRELRVTRAKDVQLQRTLDELYALSSTEALDFKRIDSDSEFEGISFVVAAYNIERQLRRTLQSLRPHYQRCPLDRLEVIIVDNGSTKPLTREMFSEFPFISQVLRVDGHPSPVHGLNLGAAAAKFPNIALMIDGAHMLSPGVVNGVMRMAQVAERPVINVPQYILGRFSQNLYRTEGAFEREEDDLAELDWPANGYALFDYAVVPGEATNKHHLDFIESNCLVTTRAVLEDCGAYDERFDEPGAGLANIEFFERLVHNPLNQYIILPGEGSFHQDHSGVTTSLTSDERTKAVARYFEKYEEVTGRTKNFSLRAPFLFGEVSPVNKTVPTISVDYGKARSKVIRQLADVYISRAKQGIQGPEPVMVMRDGVPDEHLARPMLKPLGINTGKEPSVYGYRAMLKTVHRVLEPGAYLEIGIDDGASLGLARCTSVGVDPCFELRHTLTAPTRLYREESDAFFAKEQRCRDLGLDRVELCFIDGMHLVEYVLRDFINTEKWCAGHCAVLVDDVYPEQAEMYSRDRDFNAWCGDVYRIIPILKHYRPDLEIRVYEAFAGPYRKGLALIWGLDRNNTVLQDNLETIMAEIESGKFSAASIDELDEMLPVEPAEELEATLAKIKSRQPH